MDSKTKPEPVIVDDSPVQDIEDCTSFPPVAVRVVREGLLTWYDEHKRTLPWRERAAVIDAQRKQGEALKDEELNEIGYVVWVSEIMLQQTRVETVVQYWERWVDRWPNVESLAAANINDVNEMWSGLGYYRRAKSLLTGAQMVVNTFSGRFPRTREQILKLPGVGPYTAGAVASIAYGEVAPIVDGNVIRVLTRLRSIGMDPTKGPTSKLLWKLSAQLTDPHRPGCFNQSLMELGAMLCTAKSPSCGSCPIRTTCQAHAQQATGMIESVCVYPHKPKKAPKREETVAVCVVHRPAPAERGCGREFLLLQRPAQGLLASLWEFPQLAVEAKASVASSSVADWEAVVEHVCAVGALSKGHLKGARRAELGSTVHVFSHIRQTLCVQSLAVSPAREKNGDSAANKSAGATLGVKGKGLCSDVKEEWESMEELHLSVDDGGDRSPRVPLKRERGGEDEKVHVKKPRGNTTRRHRWVSEAELDDKAISKGVRKCYTILKRYEEKRKGGQKKVSDFFQMRQK